MTDRQTEALNRLNRGIQESRQEVQQRTMSLAQEYFDNSAEVLKQQVSENRATLENLPDQIPGGRDEAFQTLFQELMENYSAIEEAIDEAQKTSPTWTRSRSGFRGRSRPRTRPAARQENWAWTSRRSRARVPRGVLSLAT